MTDAVLYCTNPGYEHAPGEVHVHLTIEAAMECLGGFPALYVFGGIRPSLESSPVTLDPKPARRVPTTRSGGTPWATLPQLKYIKKMGGDYVWTEYMDKYEASLYIDGLKHGRYDAGKIEVVDKFTDQPRRWLDDLSGPASLDKPPRWAAKRETIVPVELLEMVPDGYYATLLEDGEEPTFLRVKRPKFGIHEGRMVIQTQHGDRLEDAFIVYPKTAIDSTRVDVLKVSVEEAINLLISDQFGAARRYAKLISRCCRCNKELTDERSRKYGIGPECEKHMKWMIDLVDMEESS